MKQEPISDFIKNLFQWYSAPDMPERGIECFLWIELFKKVLRYPIKSIQIQKDIDSNSKDSYRPDIIINATKSFAYPVEIKKPNLSKSAFKNGRIQVACYAKKLNMQYAILTDGVRWDVLAIHASRNQYRHIWSHKILKGSDLSSHFLLALRPKMAIRFFNYADQIFGNIGYKKLHASAIKAAMSSKNITTLLMEQPKSSRPLVRLVNRQLELYLLNKSEKPEEGWIRIESYKK